MAQAIRSTTLVPGETYVNARDASTEADDDLGFAAALKIAIPAALVVWALGIWSVVHFFL